MSVSVNPMRGFVPAADSAPKAPANPMSFVDPDEEDNIKSEVVMVPGTCVGMIIGKQGETIKCATPYPCGL
jgi:hypothetical protein